MKKYFYLLGDLLLFYIVIFAQNDIYENIRLYHYNQKHGLSQNSIYGFAQDSKGFVWIATIDGANRFNGSDFLVYDNSKKSPLRLSDNFLVALAIDKFDRIWLGSRNKGIDIISSDRTKIFNFNDSLLGKYEVVKIYKDSREQIWVSLWNYGIIKFDPANLSSYEIIREPVYLLPEKKISDILEIDHNRYIFATHTKGIFEIDFSTKKVNAIKFKELPNIQNYFYVLDLYKDSKGNIWAGSYSHGLFKLNKNDWSFEKVNLVSRNNQKLENIGITDILEDQYQNLWISTDGKGLFILNANGTVINIPKKDNYEYSLKDNRIWKLFEDKDGNVFIGSMNNGFHVYTPAKNNIRLINDDASLYNSLNNPVVKTIAIDKKNRIFVGTNNGIVIYDFNLNKLDVIDSKTKFRGNDLALSSPRIQSIAFDDNNIAYISTWGGGVIELDYDKKKSKFYLNTVHGNNLFYNYTRFSYVDSFNNVWIGTERGLVKLDCISEKQYYYYFAAPKINNYFLNQITYIYQINNSHLLVGSLGGLIKFNIFEQNYVILPIKLQDSVFYPRILSITPYKKSKCFINTNGDGVFVYNSVNESFSTFPIPAHTVYAAIVDDKDSSIWFSSNSGIIKYDSKIQEFIFFDESDGLQSMEFNAKAFVKDKKGRIFFGGQRGLNYFDPDKFNLNFSPPVLYLTEFRIFDALYLDENRLTNSSQINLNYNQNFFSIHFNAVDFSSPDKISYVYKLLGFDKNWNVSNLNKRAIYTNVPPGNYEFVLYAKNSAGIVTSKPIKFNIIIAPPFYEKASFQISIAIILVFFALYIHFYRIARDEFEKIKLEILVKERSQKLEEEKLKTEEALKKAYEANEFKRQLLRIVAHDLTNPINSILGLVELAKSEDNRPEELQKIYENISLVALGMSHIIKELLSSEALQSGKLVPKIELINLNEELKLILREFHNLAKRKNQILLYEIQGNIYFASDKLFLREILKNLVSNAIKFSPYNSNIFIKAYFDSEDVIIEIKDQGPGFTSDDFKKIFNKFQKLSAKPTGGESSIGLGLSITKQFVDALNGEISVVNNSTVGATFILRFRKNLANV